MTPLTVSSRAGRPPAVSVVAAPPVTETTAVHCTVVPLVTWVQPLIGLPSKSPSVSTGEPPAVNVRWPGVICTVPLWPQPIEASAFRTAGISPPPRTSR